MAIYGLGCDYDGQYVGDDFYNTGVACIGWSRKYKKDYLFGLMRDIAIGDIVVLKSFFQRGGKQVLRVKAIGIVSDNKIEKFDNLGEGFKVKWLKYNKDKIDEYEFKNTRYDGGVQRRTTIYKECNPKVSKWIIGLLA